MLCAIDAHDDPAWQLLAAARTAQSTRRADRAVCQPESCVTGNNLAPSGTGTFLDDPPVLNRPSYQALADLPLAERITHLRDPEVRARILAEKGVAHPLDAVVGQSADRIFAIGEPPNYEPLESESVRATAARLGRAEDEVLYDLMLGHDGRELLMFAIMGYAHYSLDDMREMILHPQARLGLSDGGAHCGVICDASIPTFMLSHWTRRPSPRRADPARAGGAQARPRHRRGLRPGGPRRAGARVQGRPQRDRLRPLEPAPAGAGARPAGRRPAPGAAVGGLHGDRGGGRGDLPRRRGDGRPPRPPRARCPPGPDRRAP